MDRDPQELVDNIVDARCVVVLSDAVHSMSPFKGAGANQALLDGPLLASWLQRSSLCPAIKGFLREMTNRTRPRVLASRNAAAYLHSSAVLAESDQGFAGVTKERVSELLEKLHDNNIGAHLGADLDARVQQVIDELDCQEKCVIAANNGEHDKEATKDAQRQALALATQGDTPGLRKLSLQGTSAVLCARDEQDRTCLHVTAQAGHYHTCKWLLTEAFLSPDIKDNQGMTALQLARGNEQIVQLFEALSSRT